MDTEILKELKDELIIKANKPTAKGRIYTDAVIKSIIDDPVLKEKEDKNCNLVQYHNYIAGIRQGTRIDENGDLKADIQLLNCPAGRDVLQLIDGLNATLYFGPRGHGDIITNENGEEIIENYYLDGVDILLLNPYR